MKEYKIVFVLNGHRYEQIVKASCDRNARELIMAQYGNNIEIRRCSIMH